MRTAALPPFLAALTCAVMALAPEAVAQAFRPVTNQDAKVKFVVHKKLTQSPEVFGFEGGKRIARFQPQGDGDYMFGRFGTAVWYLNVYMFPKRGGADGNGPMTGDPADADGDGAVTDAEAAIHKLKQGFATWEDFITKGPQNKTRKFKGKPKKKKVRGKKYNDEPLTFQQWEYYEPSNDPDMQYYCYAAAYDLGDREVVLECQLAVDKGRRPASKWAKIAVGMLTSLEPLSPGEGDDGMAADKNRDKFADTPERKERLRKAKENIESLDNWDYYTTPHYIILYSWDAKKPEKQLKQAKFAKWVSTSLEALRAEFERLLPPHEEMGNTYPVIRICKDHAEYSNYGGPGGSAGFFRPATKEVVMFDDVEGWLGGDKGARSVLFHEGWHQYSDSWFDGPESHRWWDEGIADYFQGFTEARGRWAFKKVSSSKQTLQRRMVAKDMVPLPNLCSWDIGRFYGAGAVGNYAQAYALCTMIIRGKKQLGRAYRPEWEGILHRYAEELKKTGDMKKANKAAFKDVDMDQLERIYLTYIKKKL